MRVLLAASWELRSYVSTLGIIATAGATLPTTAILATISTIVSVETSVGSVSIMAPKTVLPMIPTADSGIAGYSHEASFLTPASTSTSMIGTIAHGWSIVAWEAGPVTP